MAEKNYEDGLTWLLRGSMITFVFIGLAVFVGAVLYVILRLGFAALPFMMFNSGWGWVWNVVGLLFLIWILLWVFRWPMHRHRHHWYEDEREIARKRYAAGEINRTQYMRIIKDLESTKE